MLRNVHLVGDIGERYGSTHVFDVSTVGEAIRLLAANFKDFRSNFREGEYYVARGEDLDSAKFFEHESEVQMKFDDCDYWIIPRLEGSASNKSKGIGQIFLGATLLALAIFTPVFGPYAFSVGVLGAGLILAGVGTLLTPTVDDNQDDRQEDRITYTFGGAVNRLEQGNAIPICYGRFGVGSIVVATSLTARDN